MLKCLFAHQIRDEADDDNADKAATGQQIDQRKADGYQRVSGLK
jgi:hypothetical protein